MPNYYVQHGDEEREWSVIRNSEGLLEVTDPEGVTHVVDALEPQPGRLHLLRGARSADVDVREQDGLFHVLWRGHDTEVSVLNERQRRMKAAGVGGSKEAGPDLLSPMAGKVVATPFAVGDVVEEGQTIIIIEAMKMENDLKAHRAGTVTKIGVEVGQAVEIGDVLITVEDE